MSTPHGRTPPVSAALSNDPRPRKPLTRRLAAAAVPLALVLTLTACGAVTAAVKDGARPDPTATAPLMPPGQALQKLDALLAEATSNVQPALRYWDAWPVAKEQYSSGLDEHSLGYAKASRTRHVMTKVAPAKYATLLDAVRSVWKAKGYRIEEGPTGQAVSATTAEGLSVGIGIGSAGDIDIQATVSPIPVPDGRDPFGTPTPDPVMANGNPDVLPKYDDPYWSL
ncbi:hypothetical protein ATKI12_4935 [Kitasatospora sp. Ki12]|uniref:hypothetical protein n=1 Tax=Kitasatospora xanthocidica TaxID=83382 RepID=UPI0016732DFF|nr:hypothetical protein [Kitasatospora xanthocidica]GHF66485.1 hypothetical protein GCM10018790_50570 [Kitasatospora xanthocidica]